MKKLNLVLLFALLTAPVFASDRKLVNGAGTIEGSDWAFSLDLGVEAPEPILYGVRFDFGIGDRVQLGAGGTIFGVVNTFGFFSTVNLYHTDSDSDFVSLYFNPFLVHVNDSSDNIVLFFIQPGLAYEHRFGKARRTGIYTKFGTGHFLGAATGSNYIAGGLGAESTILQLTAGVQHNFGGRFSLTVEPVLNIDPQVTLGGDHFGFGGKLGLTWAF